MDRFRSFTSYARNFQNMLKVKFFLPEGDKVNIERAKKESAKINILRYNESVKAETEQGKASMVKPITTNIEIKRQAR
jgi:hypothetical protein